MSSLSNLQTNRERSGISLIQKSIHFQPEKCKFCKKNQHQQINNLRYANVL